MTPNFTIHNHNYVSFDYTHFLQQACSTFMWCGQLGKIWSACGQHEIQYTERIMINYTKSYKYKFIYVFFYILCAIKHIQQLQKVPKICWYNLQKLLLWIKKCTVIFSVALWMWSEGNTPKNGEPAVYFPFMTMLQHIGWFLSRIS